jgi:aspartate/glutamate racemase
MTRIALIHALPESVAPINEALQASWPEARRMNLLDDSLSADLHRAGQLDEAMTQRFQDLAAYALRTGADALLFTCSAFGPCIEAVARRHAPLPVLKPNEAMIDEACRGDGPVGLVATFGPTLQSMPAEFPPGAVVHTALADGALAALQRGDAALHDVLAADAAATLQARGCRTIALAQFSLARARDAVARRTGLPVLTTVDSAVRRLRERLGAV